MQSWSGLYTRSACISYQLSVYSLNSTSSKSRAEANFDVKMAIKIRNHLKITLFQTQSPLTPVLRHLRVEESSCHTIFLISSQNPCVEKDHTLSVITVFYIITLLYMQLIPQHFYTLVDTQLDILAYHRNINFLVEKLDLS